MVENLTILLSLFGSLHSTMSIKFEQNVHSLKIMMFHSSLSFLCQKDMNHFPNYPGLCLIHPKNSTPDQQKKTFKVLSDMYKWQIVKNCFNLRLMPIKYSVTYKNGALSSTAGGRNRGAPQQRSAAVDERAPQQTREFIYCGAPAPLLRRPQQKTSAAIRALLYGPQNYPNL